MYVPLRMYLTITITITLGPTNSSTRNRHLNQHRVCHGRANPRPVLRDGLHLSSRCQVSAELLDSGRYDWAGRELGEDEGKGEKLKEIRKGQAEGKSKSKSEKKV